MTEIDELEGKALAEVVALSQGWTKNKPHPRRIQEWLGADGRWNKLYVSSYRPDLNIAQAWELVEKARADGWLIGVHTHLDEYQVILARHISHPRFNVDQYEMWSESAPEAICRAFLKAKEAQ